jgi:hypothetical protein
MSGAEAGHHVDSTSLQGLSAALADDASRIDILEKAFDFRGDVTLTLNDGRTVAGYIFDRRRGPTPAQSSVRLLPPDRDDKLAIAYDAIAKVDFGKDTAQGKSFETWVKKYIEKKLKGEKASIESEAL